MFRINKKELHKKLYHYIHTRIIRICYKRKESSKKREVEVTSVWERKRKGWRICFIYDWEYVVCLHYTHIYHFIHMKRKKCVFSILGNICFDVECNMYIPIMFNIYQYIFKSTDIVKYTHSQKIFAKSFL